MNEGASARFRVRLRADPLGTVNATVDNASGDTDIQPNPDPTLLTFNSDNWSVDQSVTITAADDDDTTNGTATIIVSASGLPDEDVTVTEADDDALSFQTRDTPVTVPEGGSETFDVRLTADPLGTVNATVDNASGDTDIQPNPDPTSLTFNSSNWEDWQTVTLTAADDGDGSNGNATIRVSAPGLPDRNITATELDNDTSNGDVFLRLNPSEATSGQDITVSVRIANNTQSVSNFGFDFVFDNEIFTFEGIQAGTLTTNWSITSQTVHERRIEIHGSGGTTIPASSSGTLVIINLKIKCQNLTYDTQRTLKIENYTGDMNDSFSPEPCTSIFTYKACSILGDVNGDTSVTPGDAQDAFEIFLGVQTPDVCQLMTSDANCSGSITPGDAQEIFEHFLGINILPACCDGVLLAQEVSLAMRPSGINPLDRMRNPEFRRLFLFNTTGQAGEIVSVPVLITNPLGVGRFSFDLNFPYEMLEFLGVKKSPLTEEFDYVTGSEEIQGMVHVVGESMLPIESNHMGSLAVAVFRVKEGLPDRLPIILFNPDQDVLNAEIRQGSFVRVDPGIQEPGWIILGRAVHELDGTVRIPVRVSRVFNMKSFGMEFRFSDKTLHFAGVERSDISKDFLALEGYEVEEGLVRIGGYGMNQVQKKSPGVLFNLIFFNSGGKGEVELIDLFDDLRYFEFRKRNTRIE